MDRDALAESRRPLVRTDFLRTDRLAGSGEIPCRHTEACALCRQNDEMGRWGQKPRFGSAFGCNSFRCGTFGL